MLAVVIRVVIELEAGVEAAVLVRGTGVARISGSILLPLAGVSTGVSREVVAGLETDIGGTQQTEDLVVGTTEADFTNIRFIMIYIRKTPDCTVNGL